MRCKMPSDTKGLWTKLCIISKRLDDRIAVVTGANSGIGYHIAAELARRGATVIMACRSVERGEAAKIKMLARYGIANPKWMKTDVADQRVVPSLQPINSEQLIVELLDLASLQSVRDFASRILKQYPQIHILVNNAGLALDQYSTTVDGFEQTVGVNHLGHFLLTDLLLPALRAADSARIIVVSSINHYFARIYKPDLQMTRENYNQICAYNSSKLLDAMFAVELSKRLQCTNITVVAVHPGIVDSQFKRDFKSLLVRVLYALAAPIIIEPWEGAQTALCTILMDKPVNGGYYSNCTLRTPNKIVFNDEERLWVWNKSAELVGLTEE